MGFKVAVVGATGNVGREMLNILAERRFPADEVVALADIPKRVLWYANGGRRPKTAIKSGQLPP